MTNIREQNRIYPWGYNFQTYFENKSFEKKGYFEKGYAWAEDKRIAKENLDRRLKGLHDLVFNTAAFALGTVMVIYHEMPKILGLKKRGDGK